MRSPVAAIARYTLLEALRNRLGWLLLFAMVLTVAGACFLALVSLTEADAVRAAVVGSALRAEAVFLVALFVITTTVRELNDKGFEVLASLPIARAALLAGKLFGFAGVSLIIALLFGLVVWLFAPAVQAAIWTVSLLLELLMVMALSVLCLLTFSQIPAALAAVLAFYLLARSMAAFQLMAGGPMLDSTQGLVGWMADGLNLIAYLLPSLHQFTRTEWLVYHQASWGDLGNLIGQSVIYLGLLTTAAMFDLYRKNL